MAKPPDHLSTLRRRVAQVSTGPGIYRWLDSEGTVMYVGKAKNLRNRLRSYLQTDVQRSPWTKIMVGQIADFDVTVTNSNLEALILEANLIKELRPKYNIMLKDDKNYVYARITVQDTFPRVDIVRKMEKDGALYFGPKTSAEQLRSTLSFLRTLFPYRTCKMGIELKGTDGTEGARGTEVHLENQKLSLDVVCHDRDRPTPCIDHHIKQCIAPCIGTVTPEQYRKECIDGVISFFKGNYQDVEDIITRKMQEAAAGKKFEKAAALRDQLAHIRSSREKQIVSDVSHENADVIGAAVLSGRAYVVLLQERDGKLVGEESFALQGHADSVAQVLSEFIPQFYDEVSDLPDVILAGEQPEEREGIEEWLSNLKGKKVRLHVPERGKKSKLLLLAEKNAEWKAKQSEAKWESDTRKTQGAVSELKDLLHLPTEPKRIEGYDISHLGGTETVGSMVVAIDGKPRRDQYRSFTLRSIKEGEVDDYKSLTEVLSRRLKYLAFDLKREEEKWEKEGVVIARPRKEEQAKIAEILERHTGVRDAITIDDCDYLIARTGDSIGAFISICGRKGGVLELTGLWVGDDWQGKGIDSLLIRKALRKIKKGKVYTIVPAALESQYGAIGFRYVITPPLSLVETFKRRNLDDQYIVMVYDSKQNTPDPSFTTTPDLLLIDGGKGQLGTIVEVLKRMGLDIPVAGLAKREEEIFLPNESLPVPVQKDSAARFLLQRLRDEAHRFANEHRKGRLKKSATHSILDDIDGIGQKTKTDLLKKFGSVDGIRAASDEDLLTVINQDQLKDLRWQLSEGAL